MMPQSFILFRIISINSDMNDKINGDKLYDKLYDGLCRNYLIILIRIHD